ncbi:organic cation transporter protein-like [Galleria mellonella]|uniref:Organic cation transporter protein-like n=1 Tax=Galleria mellonella TaxID=7137 RepID=A0A6J1WG69_GALME|nr:organic cation transporter protein-like [Galleria mellonella]
MVSGNIKIDDPSPNEDRNEGVDLDQILTDEIGQFGRYQVLTLLLMVAPVVFTAFSSGEYIFTTARIPTRCRIPQCDGEVPNPEFRPEWVLNAIPGSSKSSFEGCSRYEDSNNLAPSNETCPPWWFNTTTVDCDEYVYENSLTIVYDFDLGCNEWRRSLVGSISSFGKLIGIPLAGFISDGWGRRMSLVISIINIAWIGVSRSFVNKYEWFVALEVLEAATGAGAYSACYILVMELVGPKYRVVTGATMSSLFALGQVTLGLTAWAVQQWRSLLLVLYLPQFLIISYYWILPESIRWLINKGRHDEAEIILEKASTINKRQLSEKSIKILRATAGTQNDKYETKEPWLPILVIRSRAILLRCIVLPILWIIMTLIYYGLSINSLNLTGNQYLNYVFVTAIEIPGYWTAILLLDRIGRKSMLICGYWLCSACQFAVVFMPDGMENLSLVVYLIGKYSIAIVMSSIYVYTAELFPTKYRHRLFAFPATVGRLGTIIAPLTPSLASEIWESLPSVMFGSFALLAGILVFTTPETLGTKLPDTMEEAEQIESRKIQA